MRERSERRTPRTIRTSRTTRTKRTIPTFFNTAADFRRWLEKHHATAPELWVGFRKKSTGLPGMTPAEALDEALCFGWIDGVRKSIDTGSYMNRFSPRRAGSVWSAVNTRRAKALVRAGRMRKAGLAAFEARTREAGFDWKARRDAVRLDPALERRFRTNAAAWRFFEAQPPAYRQNTIWYVMSAKREPTRARRLETVVSISAAGERLEPMKPRQPVGGSR
jgi:uncharacterized protein YdeI (YjbR/CyaY-like superfamily)